MIKEHFNIWLSGRISGIRKHWLHTDDRPIAVKFLGKLSYSIIIKTVFSYERGWSTPPSIPTAKKNFFMSKKRLF